MVVVAVVLGALLLGMAVFLIVWQRGQITRIRQNIRFMLDAVKAGREHTIKYKEDMSPEEIDLGRYLNVRMLAEAQLKEEIGETDATLVSVQNQLKEQMKVLARCQADLSKRRRLDDGAVRVCEEISSENAKMVLTLDKLLQAARMHKNTLQPQPVSVDVGQLLGKARAEKSKLAAELDISLDVAQTDELYVEVDPALSAEALANILDNAIKYSKPGGKVTVAAMKYESYCRVDITDQGPGITLEDQLYIFNKYWRVSPNTVPDGMGVGLYMAREMVQAQKGYIRVSSARGQGSTFSVYLPLGQKPQEGEVREVTAGAEAGGGLALERQDSWV